MNRELERLLEEYLSLRIHEMREKAIEKKTLKERKMTLREKLKTHFDWG